jgi:hypothetical protein
MPQHKPWAECGRDGIAPQWDSFSTRINKTAHLVKDAYLADLSSILDRLETQPERFAKEVRRTVDSPDFPKADFVHRLFLVRFKLQRTRKRHLRRSLSDYDVNLASSWICSVIFDTLDSALLSDREGLRAMLHDRDLFGDAAQAIARIGPPAVSFAPILLDVLAERPMAPIALGSIGRGNPAIVDMVLQRLATGPDALRFAAAAALERMGPDLAGREDKAIRLLLDATCRPPFGAAALSALASVGRDLPEALDRVLEFAAPRPPRLIRHPMASYTIDEVMHERGTAIEALGYFLKFRDRVIPVLQDALNTFEEYDPDYQQSSVTRVEQVLKKFEEAQE